MEFSKLDILAIAKGLVPPEEEAVHGDATIAQKVTTPNLHELELSTHQAKDRRVRKVMNEFFRALILEVKEQEIDLEIHPHVHRRGTDQQIRLIGDSPSLVRGQAGVWCYAQAVCLKHRLDPLQQAVRRRHRVDDDRPLGMRCSLLEEGQ